MNFPPVKNTSWLSDWSVVGDPKPEDPAQLLLDPSPTENELLGVHYFELLSFKVNCCTAIDNQHRTEMNEVWFFNTQEVGSDLRAKGRRKSSCLIIRNYTDVEAVYWVRKAKWWDKFWGQETRASFGHVKFEMPRRHADGCVQKAVRFTMLELRRKMLAGDTNLVVINLLPLKSFGITLFPHPHDSCWNISKEFLCLQESGLSMPTFFCFCSDNLVLSAQPASEHLRYNYFSPAVLIIE